MALAARILRGGFGITMGVWAALRGGSRFDTISMGFAITSMSIPSFWLGLLLIILFAVLLPIFDVLGGPGPKGLVLPAVTLAMSQTGFTARFVRSSVVEAARQVHVTVVPPAWTNGGRPCYLAYEPGRMIRLRYTRQPVRSSKGGADRHEGRPSR